MCCHGRFEMAGELCQLGGDTKCVMDVDVANLLSQSKNQKNAARKNRLKKNRPKSPKAPVAEGE